MSGLLSPGTMLAAAELADVVLAFVFITQGFGAVDVPGLFRAYHFGDSLLDLFLAGLFRAAAFSGLHIYAWWAAKKRAYSLVSAESDVEEVRPAATANSVSAPAPSTQPVAGESAKDGDEDDKDQEAITPSGLKRWHLHVVIDTVSAIVIFEVTVKMLTRLIMDVPHPHTPYLWFWLAVAWSVASSLGLNLMFRRYTCGVPGLAAETAPDPNRPKSGRVFWEIVHLCLPDWHIFVSAIFGLLLAAAGESLLPFVLGKLIDSVAFQRDTVMFNRYAVALILTAFGTSLFSGVRGSCFILLSSRFSVRLQERLYANILRQEMAFFDANKTGEICSRLSADCEKVRDQVQLNVNVFLRSILSAGFTLGFMFYISWKLMLTAFITVPTVIILSKWMGDIASELAEKAQKAIADANGVAMEAISNVRTVKSFHASWQEQKRFHKELAEFLRLIVKKASFYILYAGLTFYFLPEAASCVVLFYGGRLVMAGEIGGGDLVSFAFYMQSLFGSFSNLGDIYTGLVEAIGASTKVFTWIFREPEIKPPANPIKPAKCLGDVKLLDVDFEYPQRRGAPVLTDLSIHIRPGEVVALCGPSGGGKSSCVQLLEHFYEPQAGNVLLDDQPIGNLDPAWYHQQVALVAQEPILFGASIKDNICYGLGHTTPLPSQAEIEEAARQANAHDFIMAFPKGYDTEVGERGAQLSGGQKQRISIARALVRNPKVLLLDEATSALDAESEHVVQEAIDKMIARGNLTVLVIAHRLSTIRNANCIVVIQNGKVVEKGTHDELLAQAGTYAQLVQKQIAGPVPGTAPEGSIAEGGVDGGTGDEVAPPEPIAPPTAPLAPADE